MSDEGIDSKKLMDKNTFNSNSKYSQKNNFSKIEAVIPENTAINIIYEDDHLILVNKPAGMVVHPIGHNVTGTLANALVWHYKDLPTRPGREDQPGLVHRIDRGTSGLLVIAKTAESMEGLTKQFIDHSIERTYLALVWGCPKIKEDTINVHLGRGIEERKKTTFVYPKGDKGKKAITHYRVINTFTYVSLVQCQLETGRTHQIRAHMRHIGHPLFNDPLYSGTMVLPGENSTEYRKFVQSCYVIMRRHALHAKTLGFTHPITNEKMQFDSPLPDDFQALLTKWETY